MTTAGQSGWSVPRIVWSGPTRTALEKARLVRLDAPQLVVVDLHPGQAPVGGHHLRLGAYLLGDEDAPAKTFASLKDTEALWTVTLEEATAMLDAKAAGKRLPLRELGKHPESGAEIGVHSGRYGPYVTDGKVNATLPKGTEPEDIDLEGAISLLEKKAARGGGGKRGGRGGKRGGPGAKSGGSKAAKSGAPKKGRGRKKE
jgi:DNA topoisomerase-1